MQGTDCEMTRRAVPKEEPAPKARAAQRSLSAWCQSAKHIDGLQGTSDPSSVGATGGLLVLKRSAEDVARSAEGFPAEAEDGGLIDQPLGDGHRLGRRGQEFPPLLEGEVGDHDR